MEKGVDDALENSKKDHGVAGAEYQMKAEWVAAYEAGLAEFGKRVKG